MKKIEQSHEYMMLDRYQSDCKFYLGNGNRDAAYSLYYKDEKKHIEAMIALYGKIVIKPLWLSMSGIIGYADRMGVSIRHSSLLVIRDRLVRAFQRLWYRKELK